MHMTKIAEITGTLKQFLQLCYNREKGRWAK